MSQDTIKCSKQQEPSPPILRLKQLTIEDVVNEARSWIGTGYHHQGRLKKTKEFKGGVDCLGLIMGTARDLGMQSTFRDNEGKRIPLWDFDDTNYSHSPHAGRFITNIEEHLLQTSANDLKHGTMLLLKIDQNPQHVGIVTENNYGLGILHCIAHARIVNEQPLPAEWLKDLHCAYTWKPEHLVIEEYA